MGYSGWRRVLFYVVVRIFTALLAGFSFACDFTGASYLSISSNNWGFIGLIAFGAFVVLTVTREIDYFLQPRPRVRFFNFSPAAIPTFGGIYYFTRIEFKNVLKNPSGVDSSAQGMNAHIQIFNNNCELVDEWEGRWANSNEPKSVGEIWSLNRYDLPANERVVLDIGRRIQGRSEFQGHDNKQFFSTGEPARKLIDPGSYKVKIELGASNMTVKDFWFTLLIPNVPQSQGLNQVQMELIN